jgi:very-short-patch-repair endonuclease
MSAKFTIKQLDELAAKGKIRGYTEKEAPKAQKQAKKPSKEKDWLKLHLTEWCGKNGFKLVEELKFSKERRFRADWAIVELRLLIEYEGLMSKKSRHTTISGFTTDAEKYNLAQVEGWKVFRYTAINYRGILNDLNKLLIDKSIEQ